MSQEQTIKQDNNSKNEFQINNQIINPKPNVFKFNDQENKESPLLFVDVNLGPERTERIIVYEGDTAIDLAEKFSKEYNLSPIMKQKLIELLNIEISGILEKIEEENSENYSEEL